MSLPATETSRDGRAAEAVLCPEAWVLIGSLATGDELDYIHRDLITSGEFQRLVEEDGVHGVTSNPTIFDKAITTGTYYDDALRSLLAANPDSQTLALFENLEIEDLQMAADILRPVYDQTKGADGFVSIEVPRAAGL